MNPFGPLPDPLFLVGWLAGVNPLTDETLKEYLKELHGVRK